jgi:phage shock protein PspC (stress-responsive transcriptional regulator)
LWNENFIATLYYDGEFVNFGIVCVAFYTTCDLLLTTYYLLLIEYIMEKKLTKSNNKMLSGVLAGIAEYLDFDPTVVRIAYLFLTLFTAFAGVIAYLLMMLVMPDPQN